MDTEKRGKRGFRALLLWRRAGARLGLIGEGFVEKEPSEWSLPRTDTKV